MNILIVEDDVSIADLLQEALEADGYSVCDIARTVEQALTSVAEHHPEWAIVDINLADGSLGTDFADRLGPNRVIKVIFSTGSGTNARLTWINGDAVMTKPYLMRDVGRAIKIIDKCAQFGTTKLAFPRNFRLLEHEEA